MNTRQEKEISVLIGAGSKNSITFIGSGDFHHLSSLLIAQFTQPLTVISFDFHPDWDTLPPRLGCGSWVSHILRKNNIKQVILLGVSSQDLSSPAIQTGNLKALGSGRVKIFPFVHEPSRVFFRSIKDNSCVTIEKGIFSSSIYWQELKDKDLLEFLSTVLDAIPTSDVYITIDKDCLRKEYSLTNWEEGCFSLEQLLTILKLIKGKRNIAGLDITGEYSFPRAHSRLKSFLGRLDHPREYTAKRKPQELINAVNEKTNLKILEAVF